MDYSKGSHTAYCHRYHVVFATKYRYDTLMGELKIRIGKIIRQACNELGVEIIKGVLSTDHVHMFIAMPPRYSLSDVMRRIKGRSSRRIQHGKRHGSATVLLRMKLISRPAANSKA